MKHFKNWFISFILGGYIVFLCYLLITGTISKYINPKLSFLSVITLVILAGMLFFSLKKWRQPKSKHDHHCNCGHHETEKFRKSSLILLLPILLAFTVAPQILSYQPVNTAPVNTAPVNTGSLARQPVKNQPPAKGQPQLTPTGTWKIATPEKNSAPVVYDEYTQVTIGNMIFNNDQSVNQSLMKAKIRLKGMVLHSDKLKSHEVIVYRILITCCTADGMPVGVVTKLPGNKDFTDGEWIEVEGAIQLLPITNELQNIEPIANLIPLGSKYPYFKAKNANEIAVPTDTYLFP